MKLLPLCLTVLLASPLVLADDGALQSKNVSKTPDWDTEHASLQQLWFNVPVQSSSGELLESIEYLDKDEVTAIDERTHVRPLIAFYEDGPVTIPEDSGGFYGHGERDMYGALSLDDGATWKRTNLSKSADKSSIKLTVAQGRRKTKQVPYPGDVFRNFTTASGKNVLAVWASRYCNSGNANYAMEQAGIDAIFASEEVDLSHMGVPEACAAIRPDVEEEPPSDKTLANYADCLYFGDAWGVAGSQGTIDFADEGYPTVGVVPYACMWAARGSLEAVDADGNVDPNGEYHAVIWRQAERLTSGRRDAHRMEAACVGGAGCVITWQEDPDGLRPGKGEGPGEGWSGAIGHHQTDIWYSYIDWDNFDLVLNDDETDIVTLSELTTDGVPKIGVPFSIPVRITDNAMCVDPKDMTDDPYCYIDFDGSGIADVCADFRLYTTDPPEGESQTNSMCVAEDGRLMRGNTASTRTRTNLRGYDSAADGKEGTNSGWVILAYEESKGLGDEAETDADDVDKIDMGKNIWYHTFDMFNPELVSQGLMLNQPAIYPKDVELGTLNGVELDLVDASAYTDHPAGGNFAIIDPDPIYSQVGLESTLYQTEIARRYSQVTQPASWAGDSGTVAFTMYKQGIVRQGGAADVFARRFVRPDVFDETVDNPFDYGNLDCEDWLFTDGSNPRYVKGLCLSTPQNLSGTTLVACVDNNDTSVNLNPDNDCGPISFPLDDLFADIEKVDDPGGVPKMTEWRQCEDGLGFVVSDISENVDTSFTCADDDINDQSWENPYDLSKGHRGFMYGDFIMAMYAWSPNWEANTAGKDNYNLYIRRSFDGGDTWTTLPAAYFMDVPADVTVVADGSTSCEWYGVPGGDTEFPACFTYTAGAFEQARNLSQFVGTKETVLDPRYAPTDPSFLGDLTKEMVGGLLVINDDVMYPDDAVDPSKFFATYEAGDTEEIAEGGEGTPMDMFYARAVNFGDEYEVADADGDGIADIEPVDGVDGYEFEGFDKLEWKSPHAAEAALKTNPGGTLFYAIWNEWMEDNFGNGYDSDAIVRRTMEFGDDPVTLPTGGDSSDDGGGGGGGRSADPGEDLGDDPGDNLRDDFGDGTDGSEDGDYGDYGGGGGRKTKDR